FSGLKETIALSKWAHWLVTRWSDWTVALWKWPLQLLHITVDPSVLPALTLGLFFAATALGIRLHQVFSGQESRAELSVRLGLLVMALASAPILINMSALEPKLRDFLDSGLSPGVITLMALSTLIKAVPLCALILLIFFSNIGL